MLPYWLLNAAFKCKYIWTKNISFLNILTKGFSVSESRVWTQFYKCFKQVQVQFNCIEVNVAQHIYVTMKTVPHYCEVKLSQQYYVEGRKAS